MQHAVSREQPLPPGRFAISREEISYVGRDLSRPECILAERDGRLLIADKRGTFTVLFPDGSQELRGSMGALPNGMALGSGGVLYVANIGDGRLYAVDVDTGEFKGADGFLRRKAAALSSTSSMSMRMTDFG